MTDPRGGTGSESLVSFASIVPETCMIRSSGLLANEIRFDRAGLLANEKGCHTKGTTLHYYIDDDLQVALTYVIE
ncbi:hypothetical protein R6Q57_016879 [Mikania cordata]